MTKLLILIMLLFIGGFWSETMATAATGADARSAFRKKQPPAYREAERKGTSEVTPDLLRTVVQKYLEGEWKQKIATVSVAVSEPADPVAIPDGSIGLQVIPGSTESGPGRRIFRIAATNGKSTKTVQVVADVTAMIDAVVPNRFLKADERIEVGDVKTVRMRVHQVNHPFITDENEVIGMSAARPLPPDVPLRSTFVRLPLVVKKGDRVLIEAQRGGLSIRTYGITKSSGQVGQTITVANLDSGRELTAKVVGPSLVQVEF